MISVPGIEPIARAGKLGSTARAVSSELQEQRDVSRDYLAQLLTSVHRDTR